MKRVIKGLVLMAAGAAVYAFGVPIAKDLIENK